MQQVINTGKAEIIVIGLPKDAHEKEFDFNQSYGYLLGFYPDNLTEEQAALVVEASPIIIQGKKYYKNYGKTVNIFWYKALDSFATLMEANKLYMVNPNQKPTEKYYYTRKSEGVNWGDHLGKLYHEAQSRTFDKWAVVLINKK